MLDDDRPTHRQVPESVLTRMQPFMIGLAGLPPDEIRKAKLLFIRNELSQLKGMISSTKGQWPLALLFGLIPLFWPFIWSGWNNYKTMVAMNQEQILNAIETWREELGEEAATLQSQLSKICRG